MLTLFGVPKPFTGAIGVIQRNAIKSWTLLKPTPEIILFGKDEGTAETAREMGIRHVPEVHCNEQGTPLVSDLFQKSQEVSQNPRLCYVNADIILLSDFMPAVLNPRLDRFLMVGQRWDVSIEESLAFADGWEEELHKRLQTTGELHPPTGIDYFVFTRGIYRDIPRFAIGRSTWDNWLIYRARALKIPVIDATQAVTVVHQNHGYEHHPGGRDGVWKGREAELNLELAGSPRHLFTLRDVTHLLMPDGRLIPPHMTRENLLRRIEVHSILNPRFSVTGKMLRLLLTPLASTRTIFQKFRTRGVY